MDDKENSAPGTLDAQLNLGGIAMSPKKGGRRGRSKSIGPGALDNDLDIEALKREAKNRRKSTFIPATRSILSKNEDAEKAARRKTMINRRVSFAPEATLHTWDIIESARDHTTSTDTSESTRRASALMAGESSSPAASSDSDESQDEDLFSNSKPEIANRGKKYRRSSGIPPMNFNNTDEFYSSGADGSSDSSGAEDDDVEEEDGFEGNTGTAMSLDVDDNTVQSARSDNSTGSSARLEAALKQAAHLAGTRGIAYDEHGDLSMEIAEEEITNAFQPWMQKIAGQQVNASMDQENVNPFAPQFNAQVLGVQTATPPADLQDEEDDVSMDVTRAVGGIVRERNADLESSPGSDEGMEFTQVVGRITSQKKRRSTNGPGSAAEPSTKRQRASLARSSLGSEMDLTMAVGGIHQNASPNRTVRSSNSSRRSSAADTTLDGATMEFTRAVGRIANTNPIEEENAHDENEELTMELTTALGAINAGPFTSETRPITPPTDASPLRSAVNVTPKDQTRFKDAPDVGPKKLLTPILQKQSKLSTDVSELSLKSPKFGAQSANVDASESASPFLTTRDTRLAQDSSKEDGAAVYPELPENASTTPAKSPISQQSQMPKYLTPERRVSRQRQTQSPGSQRTPLSARQPRSSPRKLSQSPKKSSSQEDPKSLTDSIKLLSTPRKETLKAVTPKKAGAVQHSSPVKSMTPRGRPTPRAVAKGTSNLSPAKHLAEDLRKIKLSGEPAQNIGLSDFLNEAGIKFMDLTTTKRRMTTVATPSKSREAVGSNVPQEVLDLESSVVAAACTAPELELYQHACHELKRYTREGKQMVAELEAETANETPPLLLAYTSADKSRKAELDAYMRDMKTNARLRSKEMWYAWRSQLLDELMGGLQTIGENLIKDDEIMSKSESMIERVLPDLTAQHAKLHAEADALEKIVNVVSESDKEDLQECRAALKTTNATLAERREILQQLRQQVKEQDDLAIQLAESKEESIAAMQEANRVREACRGIPVSEISTLAESVKRIEETTGWSISSASATPATLTMTYKSQLQLFFHPAAFRQSSDDSAQEQTEGQNAPIRLTYIGDEGNGRDALTTTRRFFVQLLQATCQGLPQRTTRTSDLLSLISTGWDTAETIAESERRLHIETPTTARIISDEQLDIESNILLTKVRTKVRVSFAIKPSLAADLQWSFSVKPQVAVVYGEEYDEKNMTKFLRAHDGDAMDGWDEAVRKLREKLVARGPKGSRK